MRNNKSTSALNEQKSVHPVNFMFLYLPFGIFIGFACVTLGFLLSNNGLSIAAIASVVALPSIPNIFKVLWAPLVDTTLSAKRWYVYSLLGTASGIFFITFIPLNSKMLPILMMLVLVASLVNTIIPMAAESMIAHATSDEIKGRAGGWMQAGNLGGYGLGGGAGIWLAENLADIRMAGVFIAACCLLCSLWLIKISDHERIEREKKYIKTVGKLGKSVWELIKSRIGFQALLLCLLPIGSCAASGLWSSVYHDWNASANTVALVVGILSGAISALGCLAGGWVCDRMDRKKAYMISGLLTATCALMMAVSPRSETVFVIGTSVYAFTSGLIYASFSAFVLEAIGGTGAATKYNVFAAASNTPLYFMTLLDGYAHEKWGATGLLMTEAIMPVLGILIFILVALSLKRKVMDSLQQEIELS